LHSVQIHTAEKPQTEVDMAADDTILKRIEERLTRLEGILSQGGPGSFTPPGGAVVDPAPWGGTVSDPAPWPGYGPPWRFPFPFHHPIADPAPWASQYGGGWRFPTPHPIADPAPYPYLPQLQAALAARRINIGPIGDPPPIDIGRFTIAQLESSLHTISAERARLDSMESMVKSRIAELKKG
jgi:hypothetical protein